jgi:mannose-6-phosphate isomerase
VKKPLKKLAKTSKKLDGWMRDEAWQLWWKKGRLANGLFVEALDFDGNPVPGDIARVRVQARQIYSLALAWKLGFRKKSLPRKLEQSIDRFLETCLGPEGIPGMLVDIKSGRMTDPQPNLYVTAFSLLALAQSRKVLGGPVVDPKIHRLLADIDEHLTLPGNDGYREKIPSNTVRLQNPHMHFYESLLALYKVTRDPGVQDRAEKLLGFVRDTFFDRQSGVVHEKVNPTLEMPAGEYEPGHSMEWVWLLGWRARLFDMPLDPFAVRLYEHYCASGIPEGHAPMCLTVDHAPIDPSCRLWSQTESLKAHLTIAELGPPELTKEALKRAVKCANAIYGKWLDTDCPGTFYDHYDETGAMIAKDVPASMCYHLYVMVMELNRSVKKLRRKYFS